MKLSTTIRHLQTFYKNFSFFTILISLVSSALYWEYGPPILKVISWFKIVTMGLTIYFIRSYRSKEFYYYRNLGYRDTILWTATLGFDFLLYILFIILAHQLRT